MENTLFGPRYISFGPGHFYWTLLQFLWRWLPFFWTCAPSCWTSPFPWRWLPFFWTCAPSCWTSPFPPARLGPYPLAVDSRVSVRARLHRNSSDSIGRNSCTSMQLGRKCHVVLSSQLEPTWKLVPASHTSQFFRR